MKHRYTILFLAAALVVAEPEFARGKVHCADPDVVAEEAVAYSLLGAWMPFADHACFGATHFKYFKPELADREGEVTNWAGFIWFNKDRDKYKILNVKPQGEKYAIKVQFTIKGKPLTTTYIYKPDAGYAKNVGICGFVTNPTHQIIRRDCVDRKMVPSNISF